jgi:hypothetical protein
VRRIIVFLAACGFLLPDVAQALPERAPVSARSIQTTGAQQLVGRRKTKKRRWKKGPKVSPRPVPDPEEKDVIGVGPGGRTRIEFMTGSNVFGQTTRPGEVRILERKDSELKSMVKRRTGFQREIIQTVFPDMLQVRGR